MNRICLSLLVVCVLHTQVSAQAASDDRYKTLVEEAVMEFAEGRYAEARALFRQAHDIKPNARTLRGLGMTAFELRNYTVALRMLQDALASRVNPLTPKQQEHAQGLIGRSQVFVGTFKITMPEGARIQVDGLDAELSADQSLMLDTGKHTVVAVLASGTRQERQVDVKGNEQASIDFGAAQGAVGVVPPDQDATGVVPPAEDGQPADESAARDGSEAELDILPLALMGGGGVLLLGAVVTGAIAYQAATVLDDRCPEGKPCHADLQEVKDKANTMALVTDILWVSGAVAGAIGAYLFFTDDETPGSVSATVAASHDGGGVIVRGAF